MLADPNHIASGCGMLLDYIEKRNKDENRKQLFDANNETAQLKFCLTEIPAKAQKSILNSYNAAEVCVFVKDDLEDRSKKFHEKKRKLWKNLIKEQKVEGVAKVIAVQKLKKEYKSYEDRRELCRSYDLFFADKAIIETMMRDLGKVFYKWSHKQPWPVKISESKPVDDIKEALKCTVLRIPTGTDVGVRVGRCNMKREELAENCKAVFKAAAAIFKSRGLAVKSVHVTATDCEAFPIYEQTLEDVVVEKKVPVMKRSRGAEQATNSDSDEEDTAEEKEQRKNRKSKNPTATAAATKKKVSEPAMPLLKKRKVLASAGAVKTMKKK
eukprot:g2406.t1